MAYDGSDPRPLPDGSRRNAVAQTSAAAAEAARLKQRRDYLVGIGLLLLVVLLWTGSNFLTNNILTSGWDKPWAVTYANTSSFALYLIPFALAFRRKGRGSSRRARERPNFWAKHGFALPERTSRDSFAYSALPGGAGYDEDQDDVEARHRDPPRSSSFATGAPTSTSPLIRASRLRPVSPDTYRPRLIQGGRPSSIDGRRPISRLVDHSENSSAIAHESLLSLPAPEPADSAPVLPPLTLRETAVLAAQFTLVWFAANWTLNAGLGMTSVASGTTLSSASGFFTLALGSATGVERFSKLKLLATAISFAGVVLVTHADSAPPEIHPRSEPSLTGPTVLDITMAAPVNAPLGDALSLLSAFCYALYVTLLKLRIQSEDRVSMPLFFGFVGAFNVVLLWPIGLVLHLTGVEPFQLPHDRATWIGVGVNMAITFVSDFAYLLSMLKTAPLVATVGLSLTIPLAVAIDLVRGTHSGGMTANIGSMAVLLSFVAIGWDDSKAAELEAHEHEHEHEAGHEYEQDQGQQQVERGRGGPSGAGSGVADDSISAVGSSGFTDRHIERREIVSDSNFSRSSTSTSNSTSNSSMHDAPSHRRSSLRPADL
ncbi:unnamed protein product [Parajaminaea phylloscopi]